MRDKENVHKRKMPDQLNTVQKSICRVRQAKVLKTPRTRNNLSAWNYLKISWNQYFDSNVICSNVNLALFECVPKHAFWHIRFWTRPMKYLRQARVCVTIFYPSIHFSIVGKLFSKDFLQDGRKWLTSIAGVSLLVYVVQFAFIACKHVKNEVKWLATTRICILEIGYF